MVGDGSSADEEVTRKDLGWKARGKALEVAVGCTLHELFRRTDVRVSGAPRRVGLSASFGVSLCGMRVDLARSSFLRLRWPEATAAHSRVTKFCR